MVLVLIAAAATYFLTRGGDDEEQAPATETSQASPSGDAESAEGSETSSEAPSSAESDAAGGSDEGEATAVSAPDKQIIVNVRADRDVEVSFHGPEDAPDGFQNVGTEWSGENNTGSSGISYTSVLVSPVDFGDSDFNASCEILVDGEVVASNEGNVGDGTVKCSYSTSKENP